MNILYELYYILLLLNDDFNFDVFVKWIYSHFIISLSESVSACQNYQNIHKTPKNIRAFLDDIRSVNRTKDSILSTKSRK